MKNARSIALGVGPECEKKRGSFVASCGTTDEELAAIKEHSDTTISRWYQNFMTEMGRRGASQARRIAAAKRCLEIARQSMRREVCDVE